MSVRSFIVMVVCCCWCANGNGIGSRSIRRRCRMPWYLWERSNSVCDVVIERRGQEAMGRVQVTYLVQGMGQVCRSTLYMSAVAM